MSVRIMTKVWDTAFESPGLKLVALKLADCAGDDGGHIFPSITTIARQTGYSREQTKRFIRRLIALGILEKQRTGGGRFTNLYKFTATFLNPATATVRVVSGGVMDDPGSPVTRGHL